MCLIVDANVASLVFAPTGTNDFAPVHRALVRLETTACHGGKLTREYVVLGSLLRVLREFDRKGSLRKIPDADVDRAEHMVVREGRCRSNDPHIIALARVSGVRLLCSHDQDLHSDFTDPAILSPRGSVYQKRHHRHLIRRCCRNCKRLWCQSPARGRTR